MKRPLIYASVAALVAAVVAGYTLSPSIPWPDGYVGSEQHKEDLLVLVIGVAVAAFIGAIVGLRDR
jgi:hypothetical protein